MNRILAIDFGDRRTGLAATDYTGSIVTPLPALVGLSDQDCAAAIAELVQERQTEMLVLGMPLDSQGGEGQRARRTRAFEAVLRKATPCPIEVVDERHTTDEAHRLLQEGGLRASQRKKLADSVAAMVILRRYREG